MPWGAVAGATALGSLGLGVSNSLSGSRTGNVTAGQLSPEQRALYGVQANQYSQTAPLQSALAMGQAGQIGIQPGFQNFASQFDPSQVSQYLRTIKNSTDMPQPGTPEYAQLSGAIRTSPTFANAPLADLLKGAPFSAATVGELNSLAGEVAANGQYPQAMSPYQFTENSPLANALRESLTQRPEESAYAQAVGDVTRPLASNLQDAYSQFRNFSTDLSRRAATDNPLDSALLGALQNAPNEAQNTVRQSLFSDATLLPLQRAFKETIAPEIRSAAIMNGSPGGGGHQELLTRASGRFGEDAAAALAREELNRRQQILQGGQLGVTSTNAALTADLNRRWQQLQGMSVAGTQQNALMDAAMKGTPLLQALQLAGPQAQAQYATQGRQLAGQRAMVPLSLLQGQNIQIPGMPTYPGTQTQTGFNDPSVASRIGEGIGGVSQAGLLYALLQKPGQTQPYQPLPASDPWSTQSAVAGGYAPTFADSPMSTALAMPTWS